MNTQHTMKIRYAHCTNFGVSMQPDCADRDGFLKFRIGFEAIPEEEWTPAECWIAYMQDVINDSRNYDL